MDGTNVSSFTSFVRSQFNECLFCAAFSICISHLLSVVNSFFYLLLLSCLFFDGPFQCNNKIDGFHTHGILVHDVNTFMLPFRRDCHSSNYIYCSTAISDDVDGFTLHFETSSLVIFVHYIFLVDKSARE